MRLGYALPQVGAIAGPDAVTQVARAAEAQGFDTVWTLDRLLWPEQPQAPYPATPDGHLPEAYQRTMDPIETLTFVAARTETIGLGTSVLNIPFYQPVMLARRIATLDILSGGRVRLGLGMGWSPDEFQALNVPLDNRTARADEFMQVLKACWTENPVAFQGAYYQIPASRWTLKPLQQPHPPVYLAAYSPPAMRRTAHYADGWNPAGIPLDGMAQMFAGIKQMAAAAGRDADALELVVRANLTPLDGVPDADRFIFVGSDAQIAADIAACRDLGATEVFFDLQFAPGVATAGDHVAWVERLRGLAG